MAHGAKSVSAYITHGVLSGAAAERVANSVLTELVVTDSIEASDRSRPARRSATSRAPR
jgi:ribose-phosphate pyrophosphokinase